MVAKGNDNQKAHSLITFYKQCFQEKYKRPVTVNTYAIKWGFIDMMGDLGYAGARDTIKYYFRTDKVGHPVQFLLQNYVVINKFMTEKQIDEAKRAELRRLTEQRVREWEAKNGEH